MNYPLMYLQQEVDNAENEIQRINSLPNTNKETFIQTQRNKIAQLNEAISVLVKYYNNQI